MAHTSGPRTVIAHRGASGYAPENSLEAFDLALALGADVLELDLRQTADDVVVVLHDATLARTAGDPRPLATLLVADLQGIPSGVRPARLDHVFERYGATTRYLLDLKDPDPRLAQATVETVRRFGLLAHVQVQTFARRALPLLRRAEPALSLAQLYPALVPACLIRRDLRRVSRLAAAVGPESSSVDAALVGAARAHGLRLQPYTVNEPAEMERLAWLGVDALITDVPDRAREALDAPVAAAA